MNDLMAAPERVIEVASLLIPITGRHLILPNVSVAEVIPYRVPELLADKPAWLLGQVAWRNQSVPVMSFEAINDEPFTEVEGRRIAILNDVTGDPELPFCGIITAGVPRLMRVIAEELVVDPDTPPGPMEQFRVLVAGERACIPDLALLQSSLRAVL